MTKEETQFRRLVVEVLEKLEERIRDLESEQDRQRSDPDDSRAGFVFPDNSLLEKLNKLVNED